MTETYVIMMLCEAEWGGFLILRALDAQGTDIPIYPVRVPKSFLRKDFKNFRSPEYQEALKSLPRWEEIEK